MGSTDLIPDGDRILLDSVTLIYYLDTDASYGKLASEVIERVVTGKLSGVISTVALPEVLVREYRRSHQSGRALLRELMAMPNVDWINVSARIANHAAELRAAYNLKTPDSLHVATALSEGVAWFVSNDRRLKRIETEGVRVWLFDDHIDGT